MHYSGLGKGCSTVIAKELNDRTVPDRRQERSESFWFICTMGKSPNFSILELDILPVVTAKAQEKRAKNTGARIGGYSDVDSVS
jgi:hypothetical protein